MTLSISLYIQCFILGLLGALLHGLLKVKSIQDKARKANVAFSAMDYLKEDIISHLTSLTTIIVCIFLVEDVLHVKPEFLYYLKFAFLFTGYAGNDIASRVLGAVNKRVNDVIDKKTTIADNHTGNNEPTPHK